MSRITLDIDNFKEFNDAFRWAVLACGRSDEQPKPASTTLLIWTCGMPPKQLAVADPAARRTAATRERMFFASSTNHPIELARAVIVDVEATTSVRQADVTAQRRMIERTGELWPLARATGRPHRLARCSQPRSAADEMRIHRHIPVSDKAAERSGQSRARTSASTGTTTAIPVRTAGGCDRAIATSLDLEVESIRTAYPLAGSSAGL